MIYQFQYLTVSWNPPKQNELEEWETGKIIAHLGREEFRRRNLKFSAPPDAANRRKKWREHSLWEKIWLVVGSIAILAICVAFPAGAGVALLAAGPIFFLVIVAAFATWGWTRFKFSRWVSRCERTHKRLSTASPRFTSCDRCGQCLRIPPLLSLLRLRCPRCRHSFLYRNLVDSN